MHADILPPESAGLNRRASGASAVDFERQPSTRGEDVKAFLQQPLDGVHPIRSSCQRELGLPFTHGGIEVPVLCFCKIGGVGYQRVERVFPQRLTHVSLNESCRK